MLSIEVVKITHDGDMIRFYFGMNVNILNIGAKHQHFVAQIEVHWCYTYDN